MVRRTLADLAAALELTLVDLRALIDSKYDLITRLTGTLMQRCWRGARRST